MSKVQIDPKIDPRWCEALLSMLEGDLNYNRIAEAKQMLRAGIDSLGKPQISSQDTSVRGCLFAGHRRGDCEHFVGLPGNSIPNKHDGTDDSVDEHGRPNGWCEVCWKGRQIEVLEYALFNFAEQYGGTNYAIDTVRQTKKKTTKGILKRDDFKPHDCVETKPYTAYIIEAKNLKVDGFSPVYLAGNKHKHAWTPNVFVALQFCRRVDAEQYFGENDGSWKIVEYEGIL